MRPRHRTRWIRSLLLAAILIAPLAATAGSGDPDIARLRLGPLGWSDLKTQLGLHAATFRPRVEVWRLPLAVRGARASSRELAGFKLWAMGTGFAIGRRGAGYDLAAGAALPIDDNIDLTAGYRLTGYTAGGPIGSEVDDVQERRGSPYLGVQFDF